MKTLNAAMLTEALNDLLLADIPADTRISAVNTDTRHLRAGQAFAAVRGDRFDGHDFIEAALNHGASALIVEVKQSAFVPQIIVRDTRLALGRIAAAVRADFVARGGQIIGLTGSVGKTTNKQMLAAILAQVDQTHATKGNLNNDLGVPFTWFDLADEAKFAVIEMGANHQGEIAYLAQMTRPQVAMITNAGDAHLEGFGGLEGVAKGKGELFASLTAGDTAVLNIDDAYADYWRGLLVDGVSVKTFSRHDARADVFADAIAADGASFTLHHGGESTPVSLPSTGQHHVMNALGSAACALLLGVSLEHIRAGLSQFVGAKGRLQKVVCGQLNLIDDSYNASPAAMRAAAEIVAAHGGHRMMVLGDMAELGADTTAIHAKLGQDLRGKADTFLCLGEHMSAFADNNPDAIHYASFADLMQALTRQLASHPNATVLVKGSRGMQMERVIDALQNAHPV